MLYTKAILQFIALATSIPSDKQNIIVIVVFQLLAGLLLLFSSDGCNIFE